MFELDQLDGEQFLAVWIFTVTVSPVIFSINDYHYFDEHFLENGVDILVIYCN